MGRGPATGPEHRGSATGVERGGEQPAEQPGVLQELDPLGRPLIRIPLLPERMAGERRRHERGRQHDAGRTGHDAEGQQGTGADVDRGVQPDEGERIGREAEAFRDRHPDLLRRADVSFGISEHGDATGDEAGGEQRTADGTQIDHPNRVPGPAPAHTLRIRVPSPVVPTRILLLRHGQSTWNAARRWQGQADPPLTELGEEQAYQAAQKLGTFDDIVASDLERARRTAEIIAAQLGIGPVRLDERLRENHAGEWEGLTREEVEAGWPGYLESHRRPPGFEPPDEVGVRALAALLDAARTSPDGEVLAVAHGGVIRVLRRLLEVTDVAIPNLGGSWFTVFDQPKVRVEAGEVVSLIVDPDGPGPAQAAESERL